MHHHHAIALLVFSIFFAAFAILTICAFAPKMQQHGDESEAVRANGAKMGALAALPIRRRGLYFGDEHSTWSDSSTLTPSQLEEQVERKLNPATVWLAGERWEPKKLERSSSAVQPDSLLFVRRSAPEDSWEQQHQQKSQSAALALRQRHKRVLAESSAPQKPIKKKKKILVDFKLSENRAREQHLLSGFIVEDVHPSHYHAAAPTFMHHEKNEVMQMADEEGALPTHHRFFKLDEPHHRSFRTTSTDWTREGRQRPAFLLGRHKDSDRQEVQKIVEEVLSSHDGFSMADHKSEDRSRLLEATPLRHRRPRWHPHPEEEDGHGDFD